MASLNRPASLTLFLTSCVLTLACASFKRSPPIERVGHSRTSNSLSAQDRAAIFEDVWRTINEEYYDPSFNGVDWPSVRERYRPRFEAAASDWEFYGQFEVMLSELRDGHTTFAPPPAPGVSENELPRGSFGLRLGEAEGKVAVVEVGPDTDAARAGVKPGMILRTVNGKTVEEHFAYLRSVFAGSSSERATKSILQHALLYGGFLSLPRKFGLTDFDGKLFEVELMPRSAPQPPEVVSRRLASGFGYIKFDNWLPPADEKFDSELSKLMDAPGLIIDLRGNGGGSIEVQLSIASSFYPSGTSYGSNKNRRGELEKYFTHKTDQVYKGAVVILVDETSASGSEMFPAVMQENRRAWVVGRQTCGCVLNQNVRKMKGGGTLRWSYRVYITPGGRVLEGTGVIPDETVPLTTSDLRQERDAVLEAAEKMLPSLKGK
jgi:carboxyl-terminal processing protease